MQHFSRVLFFIFILPSGKDSCCPGTLFCAEIEDDCNTVMLRIVENIFFLGNFK